MNNNEEKQQDIKLPEPAQAAPAASEAPRAQASEGTDAGATPAPALAPAMAAQAEEPKENAAAKADDKPKKTFKSWGLRLHNELTYRGVDWLFNSAVGVAFTYWSTRHPWGRQHIGQPIFNGCKKFLSMFYREENALNRGAEWGSNFVNIMAGGFTTIPPMMALENKDVKKAIVRSVDQVVYGKDAVKNDPKFAEEYKEIDNEPKKDFWSGFWARWAAILPLIAAASTDSINVHLKNFIYRPLGSLTKKGAEILKINPGKMGVEGEMVLKDGTKTGEKVFQSNWNYLHEIIGFDFGLTIFYSKLHEIAYKALAKKKDESKKEEKAEHLQEMADVATMVLAQQHTPEREQPTESKRFSEQTRQGQGAADLLERGSRVGTGFGEGILRQQEQQAGVALGA